MIFMGCLFNRNEEDYIIQNSKCGLQNAVNTFQWALIDGFTNLKEPLNIINVLPVGTYPKQYNKVLLKTKTWYYNQFLNIELGSINLPILKQYQRYLKCKRQIERVEESNKNIIIYSTYLPFLKAISKLDCGYQITLIVTDLPEYYDLGRTTIFKQFFRKINNMAIYKYLKRIDKFVLLTDEMKYPLKLGERPYIVLEGICGDTKSNFTTRRQSTKRIILYTGTLHYQFGIKQLLDAFKMISNISYELWICGSGDAEKEIMEEADKDSRIKFYGYVTKDIVNKMQRQATILINPRKNEGIYTKYSFPSKTLEYMASGIPVLMYKLSGIPDEYDRYLYYINGEAIEDLKLSIVTICEKTEEELVEFGERARNFVLQYKNPTIQVQRILDLMKVETV